jgi:hypothetical protein
MKVTPLAIAGAWLIESPVFPDERGMFREWFKVEALKENGIPEFEARQANTSISHEGVIRGIHFSDELVVQAKIVTCSSGSISSSTACTCSTTSAQANGVGIGFGSSCCTGSWRAGPPGPTSGPAP